jgi:hypothetical protein
MPNHNNDNTHTTQTNNQNNHNIQPQTNDSTPKIPPLFIANITKFSQFRLEISEVITNDFTATSKNDKIKVNVETVDDFRTLTKFLDDKKYEYYTYRLKNEKDISAIIRNLPTSITEFEAMEELSRLNFPVKSVFRLSNKDMTLTPIMAIQLENNPLSQDIFKLIMFQSSALLMNQCPPKLITAPISWQTFRHKLNINLSCTRQYKNPEDINTSIEYLTNTIKNSINQAMTKSNKTVNHSPHFLPTSIQNRIKQKHKARRIWQNTKNSAVKHRLNQLTRRVKWELDNFRYNSYSAYLKK